MKSKLIKFLNKLPYIKGIKKDLENYEKWGLPGHFYNPIPDVLEVHKYEYSSESNDEKRIINSGIDLNYDYQKALLEDFKILYQELAFPDYETNDKRYYFINNNYSYSDSIFYYSILRKFKPQRVIEIGSGFSSCVLLDTNELFFDNSIECSFVEPFPQLLKSLIKKTDNIALIDKKIQDVELSFFEKLESNDILFIDSSHVLKAGSDLNHIFFNILPILKNGVLIHFHDIFFPFKYPKEWIMEHYRAWNEIYALRLLISNNPEYKIIAFNTYLQSKDSQWFKINMPLCLKNEGGSIWLQKQ